MCEKDLFCDRRIFFKLYVYDFMFMLKQQNRLFSFISPVFCCAFLYANQYRPINIHHHHHHHKRAPVNLGHVLFPSFQHHHQLSPYDRTRARSLYISVLPIVIVPRENGLTKRSVITAHSVLTTPINQPPRSSNDIRAEQKWQQCRRRAGIHLERIERRGYGSRG